MHRRDLVARALLGGGGLLAAPLVGAQQTSNLFEMNQGAAKSVRRAPKPGAKASMTPDERDALERDIRCQCGCTLDVYICRTTDFSCKVSPAMHRDIMSLVEGGYSAEEILDAFVDTYGERALMAPKKEGFNWAGYLVPFVALGVGAIALTVVLRGMQRRTSPAIASGVALPPDATADEMTRLQDAIRRDE